MVVSLTSSSGNIPFFYPTNPQGPSNGSGWVWTCMTPRGCFFRDPQEWSHWIEGKIGFLGKFRHHLDCSCTPQVSWRYCWVVATFHIFFGIFTPNYLGKMNQPLLTGAYFLKKRGVGWKKTTNLFLGFWVQPGMPTWSWFLFAKTNSCNTYKLGLPPTQDASHHQDYYIFSRESL